LAEAVESQVAPEEAVFYIYGEPGRLPRALFYLSIQDRLEAAAWQAWFKKSIRPGTICQLGRDLFQPGQIHLPDQTHFSSGKNWTGRYQTIGRFYVHCQFSVHAPIKAFFFVPIVSLRSFPQPPK